MTTDIRAHRAHDLMVYADLIGEAARVSKTARIYCKTCDLFMTHLNRTDITIDTVKIKEDSE